LLFECREPAQIPGSMQSLAMTLGKLLNASQAFPPTSAQLCSKWELHSPALQGRYENEVVVVFTESQNGRGWKGPLWVI